MATSVPSVPAKLGKARSVCFTLNNYTDDEIKVLRSISKDAKYLVFGYEVAPTTGTPHLQGYISWDNPRSLDKFKSDVSEKLHIEKVRGSPQQASDYCKYEDYPDNHKPNKYEEFGELPRQGERTDWRVALNQIKDGVPVEEVIENQPQLLPCIRAVERFKSLTLKPLQRDVEVIVLWGEAGSGKTSYVYNNYAFGDVFAKPPEKQSGTYFDGYSGQKVLLLDDFYGGIKHCELLRVLDRWPYSAPISGGFVWAQWETVIITSNKPPERWYSNGLTPALRRRLHKIFLCNINASPTPYEPQASP